MIDEKKLIEMIVDHKEKVHTDGVCGTAYAMAHDHIIELITILAAQSGENNG